MLVDPGSIIDHLEKIHLGGLVPEAVFRGQFSTKAAAPERHYAVMALDIEDVDPFVDGVDPLVDPVGVPDLKHLVGALRILRGWNLDVALDFDIDAHRLTLRTANPWRVHRVGFGCCEPEVIGTRFDEAYWEEVMTRLHRVTWAPLSKDVAHGVRDFSRVLDEKWVKLRTGPHGSVFEIGPEHRDYARFRRPELRTEDSVEVLVKRAELAPILNAVEDWPVAHIGVDRAPPTLWVRESRYVWILAGAEEVD